VDEKAAEPFSSVDELSCYHDHPAEPSNVHLELRVPGHLDAASLRAAATATLAAEPGARARRRTPGPMARAFRWEFPPAGDLDPVSVASWRHESELAEVRTAFLASAPPLDQAPLFRLLLAAGPDQDCVLLNAHHAAFDGQSCLRLLQDLCSNYQPSAAPAHQDPAPSDPAATPPPAGHQAQPADAAARPAPVRRRLPRPVARIAADHPAADHSVAGHGAADHPAADHGAADHSVADQGAADHRAHGRRGAATAGYGFCLPPAVEVAALRAAGQRFGATVNDLLISALILAIADWNAAHAAPPAPITITMPVSTRQPGELAALGNLSRLTAVTVSWPAAGQGLTALVGQVTERTQDAKQHSDQRSGPVSRVLTTGLLPVAVKRRLLRVLLRTVGPAVVDTSLVTNLGEVGEPLRFGALPATAMAFSTSAHMPRGLSVGAITTAGRLQLCLRYRRALFDAAAAARFAACYTGALATLTSATAAEPAGSPLQ
jgi:NRPS condensation-like uncharacterized protein